MNRSIYLLPLALLAACSTTPSGPGPSMQVWPGPTKDQFIFDNEDAICRQSAADHVAGTSSHDNWMQAAVAGGGMLLGAGIGAAAGGGRGAAIGAASGAFGGAALGGLSSATSQQTLQQRYDLAYGQCMVMKGNRLSGGLGQPQRTRG